MKKVFSYSLFEPKHLPPHRTWDRWKNDSARYWYNIPTILLLNKTIYPDYEVVFYLSPNIWNNSLSEIFKIFGNVRTETVQRDYKLTEPAIWRMMPLWERGIEVFHARDVDSLTSDLEYKYIKIFENSSNTVGTIRSHENHFGMPCRMLAGLCSFKPNKINPIIKGMNFDFYYSQKDERYGSDQNLMIKTFTTNENFTKENFLDCKIDKQFNKQDFACNEANLSVYDIDIQTQKIFDKIKEITKTTWLGEPCDSRGELLNYLLDSNQDIKNSLKSNKILSDFYKV